MLFALFALKIIDLIRDDEKRLTPESIYGSHVLRQPHRPQSSTLVVLGDQPERFILKALFLEQSSNLRPDRRL